MTRFPAAEAASPSVMLPASYRVAGKRQETHDTWTLSLEPEGDELERFAPGQFAMLYSFGTGEVPISISADLTSRGPLGHTIRAVGAVTAVAVRARGRRRTWGCAGRSARRGPSRRRRDATSWYGRAESASRRCGR